MLKLNSKQRESIVAYLFILPFLLVFVLFLGYPIFYSLYLSFKKVTVTTDFFNVFSDMKFVYFKNYIRLFSDYHFWTSLLVTIYYAVLYIPLLLGFSLFLAILLNNRLKGHTLFRSAYFMPNVLDMFVVGLIWVFLYAPQYGIVSRFLTFLGFEVGSQGVLGNPRTAMLGVVIALVLKNSGFGMILFLAAIQNIPQSVYEASDIDGANALQKLRFITIPLVKPIIFFIVVTGTIGALNAFSEIYVMTGGGPTTQFLGKTIQATNVTGYYLFKNWERMDYGYAAAISYVLLMITLIMSFLYAKILKPRTS